MSSQPPSNPYESKAPPASDFPPQGVPGHDQGDATGGLIPYKNPPALIGYYLSIGSMFPCLGLPLSVAAIWLGIKGFRLKKQNPAVKGSAHAGIAVGLGIFTMLYNLPLTLLTVAGFVMSMMEA